jgi:hypothetical protein
MVVGCWLLLRERKLGWIGRRTLSALSHDSQPNYEGEVFQQDRGWSPGIGGLSYIGVAIGIMIVVCYSLWDNQRGTRRVSRYAEG